MPKSNRSIPSLPPNVRAALTTATRRHDSDNPLWQGPCGDGPLGGITQSMIVRFLSCRERFRLKYILGLETHDKWNHRMGYGNMWHVCEEALAGLQPHDEDVDFAFFHLKKHCQEMIARYPLQADEIEKWYQVCKVQFPVYIVYWRNQPDVKNRTPLLQEQVFDVPYTLPSGRVLRLRGKWDSVDLIKDETEGKLGRHRSESSGIYLQENKTKGDIDRQQVERQLSFDLQTMVYLIALLEMQGVTNSGKTDNPLPDDCCTYPIRGVRYNVVRRPLSGGKGNIKPHSAKATKTKITPAETDKQFYERLRRDYIVKEPDYWFFRVRAEISQQDIKVFRDTCLDPLLETLCIWYEQTTGRWDSENNPDAVVYGSDAIPPMNYRTPFGVYSSLEEGGATEYDHYMATGSDAGLRRVSELFTELK